MPDIDPDVLVSMLAAQEHMITALQAIGTEAKRTATALEQIADYLRPVEMMATDDLTGPVQMLVDVDPQKRPSWVCESCGQKNNGWARECGRCEEPRTLNGRRVEVVTEEDR